MGTMQFFTIWDIYATCEFSDRLVIGQSWQECSQYNGIKYIRNRKGFINWCLSQFSWTFIFPLNIYLSSTLVFQKFQQEKLWIYLSESENIRFWFGYISHQMSWTRRCFSKCLDTWIFWNTKCRQYHHAPNNPSRN